MMYLSNPCTLKLSLYPNSFQNCRIDITLTSCYSSVKQKQQITRDGFALTELHTTAQPTQISNLADPVEDDAFVKVIEVSI